MSWDLSVQFSGNWTRADMSYDYILTIIGLYPVEIRNVKWIHAKTLSSEKKK